MFQLPSNKVNVLVKDANAQVYCRTYIGSVQSSAVAISAYQALVAVPHTNILNESLSAISTRIASIEFVQVTVATTLVAVAAFQPIFVWSPVLFQVVTTQELQLQAFFILLYCEGGEVVKSVAICNT